MRIPYTIIAFFLMVATSFSQDLELARESHPHTPDDIQHADNRYTETELTPKNNVDALIIQESWLRSQLERYPTPASKTSPPQKNFGFLCPIPTSASNTDQDNPPEAWVDLTINKNNNIKLDGIALVPALYYKHSTTSNYGFPKRFKIDIFRKEAPQTPITIVDWTTQDFPDPGLSPVIFNTNDIQCDRIRLTVTKGTSDKNMNFFALDELLAFRNDSNIAPPVAKEISYSDSYEVNPYWSIDYLVDNTYHTGKLLGGKPHPTPQKIGDYIHYFKHLHNNTTITIDLGKACSLGSVELYAAHDPSSPTPSIPLPQQYQVQILSHLNPNTIIRSETFEHGDREKVRRHYFHSDEARFVRFIFTKFPIYNDHPVLAIGEMRIIGDTNEDQDMLQLDKKINITSHPQNQSSPDINTNSISLLIDGFTNSHTITSDQLHIEQLAKRALVENAHNQVIQKLTIARATQAQRRWTIGIALALLSIIIFILILVNMKHQKEQEILTLQKQISADLHDDISGNLGTISMISNRLRKLSSDTKSQEKLREIDHLSQESYISIKEIIWHTDTKHVKLSDLLLQIKRTAQSVTSDCNLTYAFQSEYRDSIVPVNMRRNIILLVKEALFNCAKYAQAQNILITAEITPSSLTLTLQDDGIGFDSSKGILTSSESGRGLLNMEQRAKLLGADLTIHSSPGKGTEIKLNMPLTTHTS
ncbi:MAG: sensor histidine kinase [Akkermansiaceae bacterium]